MIGIFDSGYGGLTILRGIVNKLPEYAYMYLGDNARAPYGERSREEILEFTRSGVEHLWNQGCNLVILACNTASACALREIQTSLPEGKKILGIIVPTIEQISGVGWNSSDTGSTSETVGILATPATVEAGTYTTEILHRNPNITVFEQPCPGLVEAIEQGESTDTLLQKYLDELLKHELDSILLGCTHYELLTNQIHSKLPEGIKLYKQPEIVADSLAKYIANHPEIEIAIGPGIEFLTTGETEEVQMHQREFFGDDVTFKKVDL